MINEDKLSYDTDSSPCLKSLMKYDHSYLCCLGSSIMCCRLFGFILGRLSVAIITGRLLVGKSKGCALFTITWCL